MHRFIAPGISRLQTILLRGFGGTALCFLVTFGAGCINSSQQQPQNAATNAVAGDSHAEFVGDGPNARQADPVGSDQFAGTSAKSRQIEKDLGVQ